MKLTNYQTLKIVPTLPFHFDSTFYKPAHFPSGDTKWQPGERWQTVLWRGERLGIIYRNAGITKSPQVLVEIYSAGKMSADFLKSLEEETIWRFNLDLNLTEFYRDVGHDPVLKPAIKRFYGLRPMHYGSLYEFLIIAIMLQNATVKRSVSMLQSLFEKYGTLLEFSGEKLWSYWEPDVMAKADERELRSLKVGYRAKSLIKVSESFTGGELNEFDLRRETADQQEKALLSLYGIGPQSVGYIMLDVFHRWDYLRHISPWEQKIYNHIFFSIDWEKELVTVPAMMEYFNRWGRWKNLAIHYVWEDIWWKRRHEHLPWLEKLIRL
jgi:3-methyladenine DNA glycosylase/8-oxoguanine DNA glycosylase